MKTCFFALLLVLTASTGMSQQSNQWSEAKKTAIRLSPHQDLKKELMEFAGTQKLKAGFIITCVGSLEQVTLRFANQEKSTTLKGHFEILSLVGTFSESAAHLHLSVADSTGKTIGGHLLDESLIYTTAEIVLGELSSLEFDRETDPTYGYKELRIKRRSKKN